MTNEKLAELAKSAKGTLLPVLEEIARKYLKYYTPRGKDPTAVAVSLLFRAADVEAASTEDPVKKAQILRRYAFLISHLLAPVDDPCTNGVCECDGEEIDMSPDEMDEEEE